MVNAALSAPPKITPIQFYHPAKQHLGVRQIIFTTKHLKISKEKAHLERASEKLLKPSKNTKTHKIPPFHILPQNNSLQHFNLPKTKFLPFIHSRLKHSKIFSALKLESTGILCFQSVKCFITGGKNFKRIWPRKWSIIKVSHISFFLHCIRQNWQDQSLRYS